MKGLKMFSLFFSLILMTTSCDKDKVTGNFQLDQDFQMVHDDVAKLNSDDLSFKIIEVVEDSRCPFNAYCTWAGTVRLKLEVSYHDNTSEEEVIYRAEGDFQLIVGGYKILLTDVTPETDVNVSEILFEEYTFTFMVTKQ